MKFFQKPIFTGFMPNLTKKDVIIALSFFLPWKWKHLSDGKAQLEIENWMKTFFSSSYAVSFDSGRSALFFALKACGVKTGDEVLVQAYTCGVVSNAIIWTGATPQYVDVNDQFTLDTKDLEKKITSRTRVLIIQHTFGIPADIQTLLKIAKQHNLLVIEDCAHVIGGKYNGKMLGTFGDIGMFSFGSDKSLSCGRGGALITSNDSLGKNIEGFHNSLRPTKKTLLFKQLFTFFAFFIFKPVYSIGIGKWMLGICRRLHLLSRIIDPIEKNGEQPSFYPARLPNAFAQIFLSQIQHLEFFNKKRFELGEIYKKTIPKKFIPNFIEKHIYFLRFPLLVPEPKKLLALAKKQGIYLGDWYTTAIAPKDMKITAVQYIPGSCPQAEKYAEQSINLPTHFQIHKKEIKRIISLFEAYARATHSQ